MSSITFEALRRANMIRLPLFTNKVGEPAHTEPDGSDWRLSAWANALSGEGGELSEAVLTLLVLKHLGSIGNTVKKIERGDFTKYNDPEGEVISHIADEMADVVVYLDLLAFRLGIDLGDAVRSKFNRVSDRVGCKVTL